MPLLQLFGHVGSKNHKPRPIPAYYAFLSFRIREKANLPPLSTRTFGSPFAMASLFEPQLGTSQVIWPVSIIGSRCRSLPAATAQYLSPFAPSAGSFGAARLSGGARPQ